MLLQVFRLFLPLVHTLLLMVQVRKVVANGVVFLTFGVIACGAFSNQRQKFLPLVHSCLWCCNSCLLYKYNIWYIIQLVIQFHSLVRPGSFRLEMFRSRSRKWAKRTGGKWLRAKGKWMKRPGGEMVCRQNNTDSWFSIWFWPQRTNTLNATVCQSFPRRNCSCRQSYVPRFYKSCRF